MDLNASKKILSSTAVPPSRPDFEVIGTFNPGVAVHAGKVKLLVRVAEAVKEKRAGEVCLLRGDGKGSIATDWVACRELKRVDPRMVVIDDQERIRLTYISHLRLAISSDGETIDEVEPQPALGPLERYEEFGVEDARITRIGDTYYITYVGVSRNGIVTALASTKDFRTYDRHGVILPPENKDVVLFPEKINGKYWAIHRPYPFTRFGMPEMWLASSPDLVSWGGHRCLLGGLERWETERVGAGPPPILTDAGWLVIYHGVRLPDQRQGIGVYSAGGLLLDRSEPSKILARAKSPFMVPSAEYERHGYVPDVVFPTGVVRQGDDLLIYYGAADSHICVTRRSLSEICECIQAKP